MQRRSFVSMLGLLSLGLKRGRAADEGPARVLLRSSWQTVNIGDIAHTPGVLALLERYLPEVQVTLWPSQLSDEVRDLLVKRFPRLDFAEDAETLELAFQECDFMLHGSGPSLVAEKDLRRWSEATHRPFGVYGITMSPQESTSTTATLPSKTRSTLQLLSQAEFVFFRDSRSLRYAQQQGCECQVMEFGPDGAFACDLRDDERANQFLKQHGLQPQKFVCCIPRLRYTPYWKIPSKNRPFDATKHARNEEMKEHDHRQLREAIIQIVERTDLSVLICPEDQTQMEVGKELLYDPLPQSVQSRVVWRPDYWLTGEAISTYVRSLGLFGNEMHSPIMCIGNGVPAIVCRFAEQTSKGFMWEDIGLGDWLFDLDQEDQVQKIVPAVLEMVQDRELAMRKVEQAKSFVVKRQKETMGQLGMAIRSP
ncbi:MAG: polysaccharide pyruvyl transferase family protein [bacterium]|nr:polysaccharide pyruvyl transferase family protein [bacterium]